MDQGSLTHLRWKEQLFLVLHVVGFLDPSFCSFTEKWTHRIILNGQFHNINLIFEFFIFSSSKKLKCRSFELGVLFIHFVPVRVAPQWIIFVSYINFKYGANIATSLGKNPSKEKNKLFVLRNVYILVFFLLHCRLPLCINVLSHQLFLCFKQYNHLQRQPVIRVRLWFCCHLLS